MDQTNYAYRPRFGPVMRFFITLAGADAETLARCPQRDVDNVTIMAALMSLVWMYQSALFAVVAHAMLAPAGMIRPDLIGVSMLVATVVLLIDSFMVQRSAFNIHGIQELKRAGIDISGGVLARIKNACFLLVRIGISVALAQLTAVFVSLLLFHTDIAAEIDRTYQQKNATLFAQARTQVEMEVGRVDHAVQQSNDRLATLGTTIAVLRQALVDPDIRDARLQAAIDLVHRRQDAKAAAEKALVAAETFSINELAGIPAAEDNTGIKGAGPVRRAAEEKVERARAHLDAAARDLASADAQLEAIQEAMRTAARQKRDQAQKRLIEVENERTAERARHEGLERQRSDLVAGREAAVRSIVERDATHTARDDGFLARFNALERLAGDHGVLAVIILIDVTSFGIELAAVLAKVFSFVPTTYATILAKESYQQAIDAAEELSVGIEANARKRLLVAAAPPEAPDKVEQTVFEALDSAAPATASAPEPAPPAPPAATASEAPGAKEPALPAETAAQPPEASGAAPVFAAVTPQSEPPRRRGRPPKAKEAAG